MKTGVVVSVIVLAILGGIYWVSTGSSNPSNVVGNDDPLAPSPTGPHPKVVVDEPRTRQTRSRQEARPRYHSRMSRPRQRKCLTRER